MPDLLVAVLLIFSSSSIYGKTSASDAYVRVEEGEVANLACDQDIIETRIKLEKVTFGDDYRSQTCSDPTSKDKLIPYCEKQKSCSVTADRNVFNDSTCPASITEKFQATWFCVNMDGYSRALEGETAALSCDQGFIIQLVQVTFGDGYRSQTCSDPTAIDRLIPYCDKQQTCNVTIDSNIFPNSSCSASITEKFQAVWFCRYDSCTIKECANGGTCVIDDNYIASCICKGEWNGTNCEISPCDSIKSCKNNGTCHVNLESGLAVCSCSAGYSGETCEVSACDSRPCKNNGTCHVDPESGLAVCSCSAGYSGETCEVSACDSRPCKNNGTCHVNLESGLAICSCSVGYSGETCEVSACDSRPCKNNGTCHVNLESGLAICSCSVGYSGETCEVSACDSRPCKNNGTCHVDPESGLAVCSCSVGYSGETCEVSACDSRPCKNNGTCHVDPESGLAVCSCSVGYYGETCEDLSVSMYNSKYSVFSGETVTLGCKIDGSPSAIVVYWTKTRDNVVEKILTNNTKYSGSAVNTPSLTIYNVDQDDDGIYICYAISTVGSFNSSEMFLDVIPYRNISITGIAVHGKYHEDSTVRFICTAELVGQFGPITAIWKFNNATINPTSNSRWKTEVRPEDVYTRRRYQLTVNPLYSGDSGTITCHLTGGSLHAERQITVDVIGKPVVTITPMTVTVNQGDTVTIQCTVVKSYSDAINITWYKNGVVYKSHKVFQLYRGGHCFIGGGGNHRHIMLYHTNERGDGTSELIIDDIQKTVLYECSAQNIAGEGHRSRANITVKMTGESYKYCPDNVDFYNNKWNRTIDTNIVVIQCSDNYAGFASRFCNSDGIWEEPDYSTCVRLDLQAVNDESDYLKHGVELNDVDKILQHQKELTEDNNGNLTPGDLEISSSTLNNIAFHADERTDSLTTDQLEIFVSSCNNLLEERHRQHWKHLKRLNLNGISGVAKAVTTYTKAYSNVKTSEFNRRVQKENLVVQVGRIQSKDVIFPDRSKALPSWILESGTAIKLNKANLNGSRPVGYSSTYYRNIADLFNDRVTSMSDRNYESYVNSDIVEFSIEDLTTKLDPPLIVEFQHLLSNFSRPICGFWNFSTPNTTNGAWSTVGSRMVKSTEISTICEYDHTTNFALLMSPVKTPSRHALALSIISTLGCGVSILFLIVTVTLYVTLWRLVKSDRSTILVNLCIALILSYTLFLIGVNRTENKYICTAVAALLHYIFLVDFAIMLAEGVNIAFSLQFVFARKSKIHWILPACWIVPAIIVAVSAGVRQFDGYGNTSACWLSSESGLIWAFIGPALLVILINFVILIFVIRTMLNSHLMLKKTARENGIAGIRSICVILPLFGVTWVFGVFSITDDMIIFQYLFAIFNSLQGFFIFLFHGLYNRQIREGLRHTKNRQRSVRFKYSKSNSQRSMMQSSTKETYTSYNNSIDNSTNNTLSYDKSLSRERCLSSENSSHL